MPNLQDALRPILSQPTPEALVGLQGALLASGLEGEAAGHTLEVADHFHAYLSELQSKLTAEQYSELASRLDIGAVGVVALENIIATEREEFWGRFLLGALAEGLMVAASRQYVKGWRVETELVHSRAAWYLAGALWRASVEMQANLQPGPRWQAIQALLAPARDPAVAAPDKAALLGRVFQMLLVTYLARLLPGGVERPTKDPDASPER
jgi:hypothetical protein